MQTAGHYPDQPVTDWPWIRIRSQPRLAVWLIVLALVVKQLLVAYFQLLAYPNAGRWFPPMLWLTTSGFHFGGSGSGGLCHLALACLAVATAPERNTHPCNTKQSCRKALQLGQSEAIRISVIRISERKLVRNPTSAVRYLLVFGYVGACF